MKKATLVGLALSLVSFAIGCGPTPNAIHAKISLEPTQKATCVVLQIQAAGGGTVLGERKIDRAPDKNELNVAIFRGSYPKDVTLSAEPRWGASACSDPLYPNGTGAQLEVSFPDKSFTEVALALAGPALVDDRDSDGYAGETSGGPDCNDDDSLIHPGATESCTGGIDNNCNGLLGCAEPVCSGQACSEPPAAIAFITAVQALDAGACSGATTIQTRDGAGAAKAVTADTPIDLTGTASVKFYADSSCATEITGIVVWNGTSQQTFYFKATTSPSATLTATLPGLTSATQLETINPTNAMQLEIRSAAQNNVVAGACSAAVTLQTQDVYKNASPVAVALTISLAESTGLAQFTFYSDPSCTAPITQLTMGAGSSSAGFHFKGNRAGPATIEASANGFTKATQSETIVVGAPYALAFTTAPQSVTESACSAVTSFHVEDQAGNAVSTAVAVNLAATNGVRFYSDSGCTSEVFAVNSAADGTGSFYFRGTTPGSSSITLSAASLQPVSQAESIVSAGPTLLAFVNAPAQATAGACSGPIHVESRDSFGTVLPVSAATNVNLLASPSAGFGFYSNPTCTTPIVLVSITSGASQSGNLYVRGTVAGPVNVTGTDANPAGLTAASQIVDIRPASASSIEFSSAAQTVTAGHCSALVTVRAKDTYGNTASLGTAATLGLSSSASPGFGFYASSDPTCGGAPVTTSAIAAGQGTTTFYFKASKSGSVTLTADGTGATLGIATQGETVNADAPAKLAFTSAPQTKSSGQCSAALNVQAQDAYGNPSSVATGANISVAAAPPAGVTFWANNTCSTALSNLQIAPGANNASAFYFKATAAGPLEVSASTASLTTATQTEQINPAPAGALAFTTAEQTVTAGQCSSAVVIQTQDVNGNPSNVATALSLSLAAAPSAGFTFYSDSSCGAAITTSTVAAGTNTTTFWFKSNKAVAETVTVSGTGFSAVSQPEAVNPDAAVALRITSAAQNVTANACSSPVDFQSEDVNGNRSPVTSLTNVSLSATNALTFYSDVACTASVTTVPLPIGQATGRFYFRGSTAGPAVVTLTAPGLGSATQTETISAGGPTTLVFLNAPSNLVAGTCSAAMKVESRDSGNNPANVTVNTTVTLTAAPGTSFAFYSNATCTTTATSTVIGAGTSQSGSFYIMGTRSGAQALNGASGGLNAATATVAINPGPPRTISFTSAAQTLLAGACSGAATLHSVDAYGNDSPVGTDTLVALSSTPLPGVAGVTFYGQVNCGGGMVTQAVFLANQSTATFYFKATKSGSVALNVDAGGAGMGTASQTETITPDVAAQLVFTSTAQTRVANVCSAAVNLQAQDQFANPSPVSSATIVSLAANPSANFGFYSDSTCTTAVSQVTINSGAFNAGAFYFKGTRAGQVDVTASSGALSSATQREQIDPATASTLAFTTTAQTVTAGACSAVATVQTQDGLGNVSNVTANLTVNLTASPSTSFTFYSDALCTTSTTSISIAAGTSIGNFYFKGGPANTVTVTAAGSGVTSASQAETVQPGPATLLKFTSAPQTVNSTACSASTNFRTEDGYTNPVNVSSSTVVGIAVTAGPALTFYSDSTCSTAITSVTLASGTGTGTFYFKGGAAGTATVTLSATGFTSGSQNEIINSGGATKLAFLNVPASLVAGTCSSAMTLQSQDSFGSPANVTSATTVSLSASPATGFAFYSNNTCNTSITSVAISNGSNQSTQFYVRGTSVGSGSVLLTANTTGGMTLTQAQATVSLTPAPPSAIEFTTAGQSIVAGTCSAVATVRARDQYMNTSPVTAATTVSLSASPSAGFTFYTDATCTTPATSVLIGASQGTTSFYFKGTKTGNVTITADASSAGLGNTTQGETLTPNAPVQLAFTSLAQTRTAGQCSAPVNVQSQDQFGNSSNVTAATTVALAASPSTGFDFYADSTCTTAISQVAIAIGGANATPFYFKGTVVGGVTVTASASGFTSGIQTEQINQANPSVLVFETAPQTRTAGQCSAIAAIRSQDQYGNVANVAANLTVGLAASPATGFTFYSDSTCTTAITSVTIAAGTSNASFYFKGTNATTVIVTAAAAGFTSATQPETIQPQVPNKLTFLTASQTITAGNCSAASDFRVEDTYGNASNVSADTAVTLTGTAGLSFYSDSACSASITTVTVLGGTSSGRLYFKGTQSGTATITLTASGLTPASQNETITAPPPTVLAFLTPPASQVAGACSGAVKVESRDLFGNPANVSVATAAALSAAPATGFAFYSNSSCTTTLTSVNIAAGASQSSAFYVRGIAVGPVTMTGASAGFTSATSTVVINPAAPSGIAFSTAAQAVVAGTCSGLATLTVHDSYGNTSSVTSATTINLSASPTTGFAFYSDAACGTAPLSSVTVAAGASAASFYFKGTKAGSVTLTADGTAVGLATTTQSETITPKTPSKLAFTSLTQTRNAGQCSAAVNIEAEDQYGNPSNVTTATTVGLAAAPATNFDFYADSTCTSAISQVSIAVGASAATPFYFKGTTQGTVTVTASATGLTSATQPEQIAAATASVLAFETTPQTRTAGVCSLVATLRTQDGYGNIANVAAALTVNLVAAPATGFVFYSDSTCTTAVTTTTVASGASSSSFYFKGTAAGAVVVTASAASFTSAIQTETITPDVASKLNFTSAAQTITAGLCSAVTTFESEDTYGNRSNVGANTTVTLAGTGGLTFYSESACTTAITTVSIPQNTATAQLYFKTNATGSPAITLTATGLTSATQTETIQSATATVLVFLNAPPSQAAGACSPAMTAQSRDSYGNPSSVTALTTVSLTATPPGNFGFYSDNACGTAITTATIASGANQSGQFYVKGTLVGTVNLAGASAGFTSAAATVGITPANPSALVFTSAVQSLVSGTCSAAAGIRVNDAYGNASPVTAATTLNLSANPTTGFTFYSDSTCTTTTTATTVAAGASTASFWFKSTKSGAPIVTVDGAGAGLGQTTQAETITPAAVNKLNFTSATQSLSAGVCSAIVNVESEDQYGNPANVAAVTAVNLTANPAAGFTLYSDSTCTTTTLQTTIAANASAAAPFYFKGTAAGSVVVTAAATGLTSGTQTETIASANPSLLAFQTTPQTKTAGQCSGIATLQTQDSYGNVSAVAAALTVNLTSSPTTGFLFYSDSTCTTTTTTTTVPAGASLASFYFKGTRTGSFAVTAAATGYTSANQTETLVGDVPNKLAFTSAPQTFTAGLCSSTTDFEVEDSFNNQVSVAAATTVTLGGPAGVTFYSDSTCTTSITTVQLAAGTSVGHFWFKGPSGTQILTISATGLTSANQTETLNTPGPVGLQFINMPANLDAGVCVPASANVQVVDQFGSPANVTANTTVNLSGTNGVTFYSRSTCTNPLTSVTVGAGTSTSGNFWFRLTQAGTATFTATAPGLTNGTYSFTVNPGAAAAIDFQTTSRSALAGVCSADLTIRAKDANGNTAPVSANTTVNLAANPAILTFYTDSACTTPAASVTILATQATATFYYRGTTVNPSITVNATTGTLGNASQPEAVTANVPNKLAFTSGSQTRTAGVCSAAAGIQSQDAYNNPVNVTAAEAVALSGSAGVTFYSDNTCTTTIAQVTIPAGGQTASFYFNGTASGPATVTATGATLTAASQSETINPAARTVLAIITPAMTMTAGVCYATPLTLQTQDTYGNPSPGAALNVTLSNGLAIPANFTFYTAAGCSGASTNTVTIPNLQSSVDVYVKGVQAGPVTVTAAATGFTSATQTQTVNAAAASRVAIIGTSQSVVVSTCSAAVTVQSQDAWGNPIAVTANKTVNLTTNGAGVTMHNGAACSGASINSANIPNGSMTATFYFTASTVQTFTITANVAGWTPDGAQVENIIPAPPTKLAITTSPQTIAATSTCSGVVTVQAQDGANNPSNVTAATIITLTSNAIGTWTFYSDATCTTPATSVTILAGTNSQNFYFVGRTAQTATITAAATGLTSATQSETITAGPAAKLAFTTAPMTLTAGTCSASQATVQSQDQYNNPVNVTAAVTVSLVSGDPTLQFYSNGTCGSQVTSVTISAGSSTASFNLLGTKTLASVLVTASALAPYTSATQTEAVNPGAPSRLNFFTPSRTVATTACSPVVTLEALDGNGNRANTAVTVNLTTTGGGTVTFYSDATCATSIGTTLNIPAGAGAADMYFKATSTGTMTITAQATGLTQASQSEYIGSLVQSGTTCILSATTGTCNLTTTLTDLTRSILFYQAVNTTGLNADDTSVICYLSSTTQITCERGATTPTGTVNLSWYVVEFPAASNVRVWHTGPVACAATINLTAIGGVYPTAAESFVLVSTKAANNANSGTATIFKRAVLAANGRSVTLNGGCAADTVALDVVDYPGAVVERGQVTINNASSSATTAALPDVTGYPTFLLYSYDQASTGSPICPHMVRGWLSDATHATFRVGDSPTGCAANTNVNIEYERVRLPLGNTVQQVDTAFPSGTSASSTIAAVDLTRATPFAGGQSSSGQATGETSANATANPNAARARHLLTNSTTLQLQRGNNSGTATFTNYVVEWAVP